jgi:hypothetical protein
VPNLVADDCKGDNASKHQCRWVSIGAVKPPQALIKQVAASKREDVGEGDHEPTILARF